MKDEDHLRCHASEIIRQLYLDGREASIEILKGQCSVALKELRGTKPKPKKAQKRRKNLNPGTCCACLAPVAKGEGNIEVWGDGLHYLTCPKCFPPGLSANAERRGCDPAAINNKKGDL